MKLDHFFFNYVNIFLKCQIVNRMLRLSTTNVGYIKNAINRIKTFSVATTRHFCANIYGAIYLQANRKEKTFEMNWDQFEGSQRWQSHVSCQNVVVHSVQTIDSMWLVALNNLYPFIDFCSDLFWSTLIKNMTTGSERGDFIELTKKNERKIP